MRKLMVAVPGVADQSFDKKGTTASTHIDGSLLIKDKDGNAIARFNTWLYWIIEEE